MKRLLFCLFIGYVLVCLCLPLASAQQQVVWCTPKEVRWGDTLTIYYNTRATKATLSVRDEVYANFYFTMTDGSFKESSIKLSLRDTVFIGKYVVEDSLSDGRFAIHTPEKSTRIGDDFIALRRDGIPARGAMVSRIWQKKMDAFTKELALYPDNFTAYTTKWEYMQYGEKIEESKLKAEVKADIVKLESVKTPNPEWYGALAEAYKTVGKTVEYITMLKHLGNEFPLSSQTIIRLLGYSARSSKPDSNVYAVRTIIRSIAEHFPASLFAREMVKHSFADTTLKITTTKNIFDAWIAQEPNNLEAYMEFLRLAKRTKPAPDNTALFAQCALNLMMKPDVRVRYQMNNTYSIGDLYSLVSEGFIAAGHTGQALVVLKAAHSFEFDTETQSELFAKEGSLLRQSGQPLLAQEAFVKSYTLGSKTAKDSALAVYKQIYGTDSGFAASLKQKPEVTNQKTAPTFTKKGLDGKTYDITKLKGKVVVLNFWFIGCTPCRQEIPSLNTLVKEFAKKDVVFLALALDEEKDLKEFLKKSPFAYTVIPKASEVREKYGVDVFPTHIIIDRNGMNIGQLVGGSETRHEDLRPLIERALGQ